MKALYANDYISIPLKLGMKVKAHWNENFEDIRTAIIEKIEKRNVLKPRERLFINIYVRDTKGYSKWLYLEERRETNESIKI